MTNKSRELQIQINKINTIMRWYEHVWEGVSTRELIDELCHYHIYGTKGFLRFSDKFIDAEYKHALEAIEKYKIENTGKLYL